MDTWIGIDLGGTYMRAALFDGEGNMRKSVRTDTRAEEGAVKVLGRMADAVRSLKGWDEAGGVGALIPGGVSKDGETVTLASNLLGFDGFPVKSRLAGLLSKPVVLENDANAACLAEALLGAGQGMRSVVYITVSTGIGGGICLDGRILQGVHGCAGEFGCMSCDPGRTPLGGLPPGAIESEASGEALTRKARAALKRPFAHAGEVFSLASSGHKRAEALVDKTLYDLSVTLSNIASVLDPDLFVLGGGCLKSGEFILPRLIAHYRAFAHPVFRDIPIVPGRLAEPGLIGAAMHARNTFYNFETR